MTLGPTGVGGRGCRLPPPLAPATVTHVPVSRPPRLHVVPLFTWSAWFLSLAPPGWGAGRGQVSQASQDPRGRLAPASLCLPQGGSECPLWLNPPRAGTVTATSPQC